MHPESTQSNATLQGFFFSYIIYIILLQIQWPRQLSVKLFTGLLL